MDIEDRLDQNEIRNFTQLAEFLESFPHSDDRFHMRMFVGRRVNGILDHADMDASSSAQLQTDCNTVACVLGWSATLPGLEPEVRECWHSYSLRVFGVGLCSYYGKWVFGGFWADFDNTVTGAAKRIRLLLADKIPDEFAKPGVDCYHYHKIVNGYRDSAVTP